MPINLVMAFINSWWKGGIGFIVGAIFIFPIAQCSGEHRQKKLEAAQEAIAVATALKTDQVARYKSANERLADAQAIAEKQKELTDVVADLPDESPTTIDLALACQQLRNQGTDISDLPACRPTPSARQTNPSSVRSNK